MRTTARALGLAGLWSLAGSAAWACSGPGAAEAIAEAERMGLISHVGVFLTVVVATVVAVRRRIVRGPVAAGWVLVIVHPNLWGSARGGDCGQALEQGSLMFAVAAAALLVYLLWRPAGEPPAPVAEED